MELRLQAYLYATWAAGLFRRGKGGAAPNTMALPAPPADEGGAEGKVVGV